ncbi:hypothetical protein B4113_0646 [Geobacillus sp. B4113_201601]|nr:hypothetical protein B4113_0646 [Geobacillus sp. B4113_201601]
MNDVRDISYVQQHRFFASGERGGGGYPGILAGLFPPQNSEWCIVLF